MQVYLKEVPFLPTKSLSLAVSASKEVFPSVLKWNITLHSEVCNSIVYNLVLYIFHIIHSTESHMHWQDMDRK